LTYGAFFDDTGTSPSQRIAAFAGYVAPMEEWTAFEGPWRDLLTEAKVPYFRAYDCVRCTGVFDGTPEEDCRRYYTQALNIITGRAIMGIGHAGRRQDFKDYGGFNFGGGKWFTDDPFEFSVMLGLMVLAEQFIEKWPGQTMSLVCEDGKVTDNESISRAFYTLRDHPELEAVAAVFDGPVVFRSKQHHYGLQAADVLAYELGLDLAARAGGQRMDRTGAYRPEFDRLSSHIEKHGGTLQIQTYLP
jgi:hypothetical protein